MDEATVVEPSVQKDRPSVVTHLELHVGTKPVQRFEYAHQRFRRLEAPHVENGAATAGAARPVRLALVQGSEQLVEWHARGGRRLIQRELGSAAVVDSHPRHDLERACAMACDVADDVLGADSLETFIWTICACHELVLPHAHATAGVRTHL